MSPDFFTWLFKIVRIIGSIATLPHLLFTSLGSKCNQRSKINVVVNLKLTDSLIDMGVSCLIRWLIFSSYQYTLFKFTLFRKPAYREPKTKPCRTGKIKSVTYLDKN